MDLIRYAMAAGAVLVAFQFLGYARTVWARKGWGLRIAMVGGYLYLVYFGAGQFKALDLTVPVDAYTMPGIAALALVVAGLGIEWVAATFLRPIRERSHDDRG